MIDFIRLSQATPISIEHKSLLDDYFRKDPPQISELTFTNLFIWKNRYHTCWKILKGCLVFWLINGDQELSMLPPLGDGNKSAAFTEGLELMKRAGRQPRMSRVDRAFIERYVDESGYNIASQPEQDDYVYLRRELVELSGNRFHRKKNHLNKFLKTYPGYEYKEINESILPAIKTFQEEWCLVRECTDGLLWENEAIMLALNHYHTLELRGAAIFIDNQVAAYSFGEPLNSNTAVIHVEKGNSEINGIYVAINQMFCQNSWKGFTYINREQDLGLPGLQAAKRSYNPHHLVSKYLVTPNYSDRT